MDHLGLDYETFSTVSLPDVGGSVYAKHPDTEILMAAYNFNHGLKFPWLDNR